MCKFCSETYWERVSSLQNIKMFIFFCQSIVLVCGASLWTKRWYADLSLRMVRKTRPSSFITLPSLSLCQLVLSSKIWTARNSAEICIDGASISSDSGGNNETFIFNFITSRLHFATPGRILVRKLTRKLDEHFSQCADIYTVCRRKT